MNRKTSLFTAAVFGLLLGSIAPLGATDSVLAASYSVYLSGDNNFTDSASVFLSVGGSASMGGVCGGICGITGALTYDSSKIELMEATALQGFSLTQGSTTVLYKTTAAGDGPVMSLRFRNVGLSSGESATITFSNIIATNGDTKANLESSAKTIQYISPSSGSPATGTNNNSASSNTGNTVAESQPATTNSRSADADKKSDDKDDSKSNDDAESDDSSGSPSASLKTLRLSAGNISFSPNILTYDVLVDSDVDRISIVAVPQDGAATVSGTGTFDLAYGNNTYTVTVVAEDGSEKVYTLKIYREMYPLGATAESGGGGINLAPIIISVIFALGVFGFLAWLFATGRLTLPFLHKKQKLNA